MEHAKSVFEMLDITPPDIEQAPGRSAEFLNILINSRIDSAAIKIRNINMQSYFHDHNYVPNLPVRMLNEINKVSPEEIQNIEANTHKKSRSKLWHRMRRTRITGAIIGSIERTVQIMHLVLPCDNLEQNRSIVQQLSGINRTNYVQLQKTCWYQCKTMWDFYRPKFELPGCLTRWNMW